MARGAMSGQEGVSGGLADQRLWWPSVCGFSHGRNTEESSAKCPWLGV